MYMIETHHTKDECLKSLDAQLDTGPQISSKFYYGCRSGDHTGYALVDIKDEKEGMNLVPDFLRSKTKIVKVAAFTPDEIKEAHTKGSAKGSAGS